MNNLNRVANYANDQIKVSKKCANGLLENIINNMTEQELSDKMIYLGRLYSYFLPAIPALAKTDFDLARKYQAKKDVRYYLNSVYVNDKGQIQSTDGHKLVQFKENSGMEPGYYDDNKQKLDIDARYPDVERVKVKNARSLELDSVIKTCFINSHGTASYLLYLEEIRVVIDKSYYDLAVKHAKPGCNLLFVDRQTSITFDDCDKIQLIMPIRLDKKDLKAIEDQELVA